MRRSTMSCLCFEAQWVTRAPARAWVRRRAAALAVCIAIAAQTEARAHDDGAIIGWGSQVVVPQSALSGLVAVAAGSEHSLGLKGDGSIVAWGSNYGGQCDVPAPNAGFVAVS